MPLGKLVGRRLLQRMPGWLALVLVGGLGVLVTYAEPALGALLSLSSQTRPQQTPYLYYLLHQRSELLVLSIGIGLGGAAVLGTLRLWNRWQLRWVICGVLVPAILLSIWMALDWRLSPVLPMAWDVGSIVTGPVAIPTLLALGIGIAGGNSADSTADAPPDDPLAGFGMIALGSLLPIVSTQLLAIGLAYTVPFEVVNSSNMQALNSSSVVNTGGLESSSPYAEVIYGLRAILPTTVALVLLALLVNDGRLPVLTMADDLYGQQPPSGDGDEAVSLHTISAAPDPADFEGGGGSPPPDHGNSSDERGGAAISADDAPELNRLQQNNVSTGSTGALILPGFNAGALNDVKRRRSGESPVQTESSPPLSSIWQKYGLFLVAVLVCLLLVHTRHVIKHYYLDYANRYNSIQYRTDVWFQSIGRPGR
jgi:hypothetical protein